VELRGIDWIVAHGDAGGVIDACKAVVTKQEIRRLPAAGAPAGVA